MLSCYHHFWFLPVYLPKRLRFSCSDENVSDVFTHVSGCKWISRVAICLNPTATTLLYDETTIPYTHMNSHIEALTYPQCSPSSRLATQAPAAIPIKRVTFHEPWICALDREVPTMHCAIRLTSRATEWRMDQTSYVAPESGHCFLNVGLTCDGHMRGFLGVLETFLWRCIPFFTGFYKCGQFYHLS